MTSSDTVSACYERVVLANNSLCNDRMRICEEYSFAWAGKLINNLVIPIDTKALGLTLLLKTNTNTLCEENANNAR